MTIEQKLAAQGLSLPDVSAPRGSYMPYAIHGEQLFVAGMVCARNGVVTHLGKVGAEQTIQTGYEAAKVSALATLAVVKIALGDLERVRQFLLVTGYVNGVSGFSEPSQVVDGATDLFQALFDRRGLGARVAICAAGLPRNATVEIQTTLVFRN